MPKRAEEPPRRGVRVPIVAKKRVTTVEPRGTGKPNLKANRPVKQHLRQFRQRISKEEKTCGNATRPNAGFGASGCWRPSKEGSKEASGLA